MREAVLVILYAIEIIKYYLLYNLCYDKKIKKAWTVCVGAIIYSVVLFLMNSSSIQQLRVIMYFIVLGTVLLSQTEKWAVRIRKLFTMFLFLNCSDEVFQLLGQLILGERIKSDIYNCLCYMVNSLMSLLVISLGILVKKKKIFEKKVNQSIFERCFLIIVGIMMIGMLMTIASLNYAGEYIDIPGFYVSTQVLCVICYVSVALFGGGAVYIKELNKNMMQMLENERMLKNIQKHYYEKLLEKEQDTRKYRHDMINHLICLSEFAREGKIQLIKKYLEQMESGLKEIQDKCYVSGNEILDAITNYYIAMLDNEVEINILGKVKIVGDNMRLCTIYANLLQNATEELLKEPKISGRFIKIVFEQGKEYLKINITNNLAQRDDENEMEGKFGTSKKDKRNHGMGLLNVKKAVEDIGGEFEIERKDGIFCARVTVNINRLKN